MLECKNEKHDTVKGAVVIHYVTLGMGGEGIRVIIMSYGRVRETIVQT